MIEEYNRILKGTLTQKRYEHCVNVSKKSVYLAKKYGADIKKAEIAGLLHDITKETEKEEQLKIINAANMELSPIEMKNTKLWHAVSGAAYLKSILNINDQDMLNAVMYHTTGRAGMSKLEKVVFLADLISDERDFDGIENIRNIAEKSLDGAVCMAAISSIVNLLDKKYLIASNTLNAYNDTVEALVNL